MGTVETRTDLVTEVFAVVGRFRRQLRRSAGRSFDNEGLSESQGELLRLVGRRPGISVSEAAAELGLVANTASTLVSRLSAAGHLERETDPADRRIGRLRLTASAQHIADTSRSARRAVIAEVLDELDESEIASLQAGLEILTRMTRKLNERQP